MKRYLPLLAIAVMLSAIIGMSQYVESDKKHYEDGAKQAKAAAVAKGEDGNAYDDAHKPYEPPVWAKYVTFPEGVGAWAVILTLFVIGWQSIETRAAAKATEAATGASRDSIRLQEIALAQWPDIEIIGHMLEREPESPEKLILRMRWKVLNSTSLPFTLDGIEIHLAKTAEFWEISQIEEESTLPPGGGGLKNFYPFFVDVELDRKETERFLANGLAITVQMKVYYTDAAGNSQERFFGEQYECTKTSMKIMEGLGKTPKKRIERDDSPSTIVSRPVEIVTYVDDGEDEQKPN
jgi:hypothetical protein